MSTIKAEHFKNALLLLLDETFENVQGIFLDKHTSLFETLAGITSDEASVPVGSRCATLAAQVKHVAFYLEKIAIYMQNSDAPIPDWSEIWRTVSKVTPQEWQIIQSDLRIKYHDTRKMIESKQEWPNEMEISLGMALVVHSAYHLGEIRQALCSLKH